MKLANGLKVYLYYSRGKKGALHTGLVVAHDFEEAKKMILFPETLLQLEELQEFIDTTYVNSKELL